MYKCFFQGLIAFAAVFIVLPATAASVLVDGVMEDWPADTLQYEGEPLPGVENAIPRRVYATSTVEHLFLRIQLTREMKLQESNSLCLYIDTDNRAATGRSVEGIGAEFRWCFGRREGTVYAADGSQAGTVRWHALGIRQEPTTSSDDFEFALRRDAVLNGGPLLAGSAITLVLRNEARGNGSWWHTPPIHYVLANTVYPSAEAQSLSRGAGNPLRILTHNTYRDGWFDSARESAFNRLYTAVAADLFCLQEMGPHPAGQVAQKMKTLNGIDWHVAQQADCVVVSRWPLGAAQPIGDNMGVLVDLPDDRYAVDLYVITCHTPCCDKDEARQAEVDAVIAHVRELKTPGSGKTLPEGTPIVIVGDMNFVGWRQQLDTMLTGDIQDETAHGPDHAPDWDGSAITDLFPHHIAAREVYTWRDDTGSFMPGRLDFVFYTDSVVESARGYVLCTRDMPPEALAAAGMQAADSATASDHLPVVCDLHLTQAP